MYQTALYTFHLVYFITYGISGFLSKYFGEIGIQDWQIGLLTSAPAIVGVLFQPYWGILTDRLRYKKYVLVALLAAYALICFWLNGQRTFFALLLGMVFYSVVQMPIAPAYSTITLEYMREIRKPYGPMRLLGTVGYQVGALATGAIFVGSLHGIYRLMGAVILLSCINALFLPPVQGHQYRQKKISFKVLLEEKQMILILAMILIGAMTSQFYMGFFGKHLGDLGVSNSLTGVILFLSVLMELPFLIFADKLARKTNIWNWILIGYALNAVRYIAMSFTKSIPLLMLVQLPAMSVMACFEFYPLLYLNMRSPNALKASAQNLLMLVSFGLSKVVGNLLGGMLSQLIGIPAVFAINGIVLIAALAAFWNPTRRLIAIEGNIMNEA